MNTFGLRWRACSISELFFNWSLEHVDLCGIDVVRIKRNLRTALIKSL